MKPGAGRTQALVVAALVGMATTYVWCKVETRAADEGMLRSQARLESLNEERARLLAHVARQTRPDRIRRLASEQLGMVPPAAVGLLGTRLADATD